MKNEEDWLDTLLHDDARETVADAGFTQRVMQSLPPKNRKGLKERHVLHVHQIVPHRALRLQLLLQFLL